LAGSNKSLHWRGHSDIHPPYGGVAAQSRAAQPAEELMDTFSTTRRLASTSTHRLCQLTMAATMLVALGSSGTVVAADAAVAPHTPQHRAMDDDHLRAVVQFVTERINEPQKGQVERLANDAFLKLDRLERRAEDARAPRGQILLADRVDRDALERARVAELHIADERSRNVDHLLIDIAEVLTPQQRALLRTEMTQ